MPEEAVAGESREHSVYSGVYSRKAHLGERTGDNTVNSGLDLLHRKVRSIPWRYFSSAVRTVSRLSLLVVEGDTASLELMTELYTQLGGVGTGSRQGLGLTEMCLESQEAIQACISGKSALKPSGTNSPSSD
jgi:hypothetical protein